MAPTLAAREEALLALVEVDRARKCDAIRTQALASARATLRDAHAEARVRMRIAFVEERERTATRVAAATANLQTRQRLARQQREAALLAAGLRALSDALVARWRDPAGRRAWTARAMASACSALPQQRWRVVYAADWPVDEREAFVQALAPMVATPPSLDADPSLRAGLRIEFEGNVVDATLDALLADRAEIGALLLDLIER